MRLKDGRRLGYAESGSEVGEPVFVFHPVTRSRLQFHPNESIGLSKKCRLYVLKHVYKDNGNYVGSITITDNHGGSASTIMEILVFC